MEQKFEPGLNIAIKVPKNKYEETVAFYRDILKFEVKEHAIDHPTLSKTYSVKFGSNVIWLDCVDNYSHAETWLQLRVANVKEATDYLRTHGIDTRDELEQLPETMHGYKIRQEPFLICNPRRKSDPIIQ